MNSLGTHKFSVKAARRFAESHGLADESRQISSNPLNWSKRRTYNTSVFCGYFIDLFQRHGLLDEYKRQVWQRGIGLEGDKECRRCLKVKADFDKETGGIHLSTKAREAGANRDKTNSTRVSSTKKTVEKPQTRSAKRYLQNKRGETLNDLANASDEAERSGYFSDPLSEEDARTRVMREIVQRLGQPQFRVRLVEAYRGRCAVTGCSILQVLEAAHIVPYRGEQTNTIINGLLLRADIHTLFDLNLLGINPDDSFKVTIAAAALGDTYEKFNGTKLRLPKDNRLKPSQELLRIRWREFLDQ